MYFEIVDEREAQREAARLCLFLNRLLGYGRRVAYVYEPNKRLGALVVKSRGL